MQEYVVGFLIDPDYKEVVLIKKDHPEWQAGKLNGPGGKVLPGETPYEAMKREFQEETGYGDALWKRFCYLYGSNKYDSPTFGVHFFYAWHDNKGTTFLSNVVKTMESEEVVVKDIKDLDILDVIPNLRWLIPMALSMKDDSAGRFIIEEKYG